MTRSAVVVVGAVLLLAACAGEKQARLPQGLQPSGKDPSTLVAAEKPTPRLLEVAKDASGAQAGQVQEVRGDLLLLDPYQSGAGTAYIRVPEDAQVFREGVPIDTKPREALKQGSNVNVLFGRTDPNAQPIVVGIELLSQAEAQKLERGS